MKVKETVFCFIITFFFFLASFAFKDHFFKHFASLSTWDREMPKIAKYSDPCFNDLVRLLDGRNWTTGPYFFTELDPPIPIDRVRSRCRTRLIPESPPKPLSKKTIECYSYQFVTNKSHARVRAGLKIVKKLFDDNKIPLIVAGGSLLGSLRYHGIIPYDDDFDFRIPKEKSLKIKTLLQQLCKKDKTFLCRLELSIMDHYQLLIGVEDVKKQNYASFIDFFFYEIQGDRIKVTDGPKTYPKSVLFPTVKRPLEGHLYDFPRQPESYYKLYYGNYGFNECDSYNHLHARRKGCGRVPCSSLNSFLPFVVSSESWRGHIELLVHKGKIHSIFFQRKNS